MTLTAPHTGATLAALAPMPRPAWSWTTLLGAALSVAMVVGLVHALAARGLGALTQSVPGDPRFYLCFALFYMTLPMGDFLIFRRLWGIPLAGLAALVKKRIANDLIVNYTGEAYFYSWARTHARRLVAAPFGAIKDVSILSAIAGNALTLAMIAVALPLGRGLLTPDQFRLGLWSTVAILVLSLPFLLFARRVFSLPRRQLRAVFAIHCARIAVSSVLVALCWHLALPAVPLATWLLLSAGRLLVSRLPFVPNKELLFVTFASLLIGGREPLVQLLAIWGALVLAVNGVLIAVFAVVALVRRAPPRPDNRAPSTR